MPRNEVTFVSGQRGSGKSYWVKSFVRGLSRFILYDPLGEYEEGHKFSHIQDLIEYLEPYEDRPGFFEAVFDPLDDTDFPLFCEAALAVGEVYVIVEEIDQFATPHFSPLELQRLIKYGRHRGCNLLGVSRRPSEVSRLFTSQTTRFILFRQFEPRDIAYYRSILGELADELPRLLPWYFFDVEMDQSPLIREDMGAKILDKPGVLD